MEGIAPHSRRVLIVDDIEDMRQALIDSLTL
jgi:hypoxanthine phosphoribosyltransferase